MARTAHPLKRPAKGSRSSKAKKYPKTPRLDSLAVEVKWNQLRCSILTINRRYCDEAIKILKSRLTDKLTEDQVKEIQYLRIDTPGHHCELLDFFGSLPIQIDTLGICATIEALENEDWMDKALSLSKLDTFIMSISSMKGEKIFIADRIIQRSMLMRNCRVEFLEEIRSQFWDTDPYVDSTLITDAYLLKIAKTMSEQLELNVSATLLTVDGILAVAEAIAARPDPASLRFQLDCNAREFKADILKRWGIKEIIDKEFQELNEPRTTPFAFEKFTMYNEGCENICVFEGRIVFKFATEFLLDGNLGHKRIRPHRFTTERVIDSTKQLGLDRGFFEIKHN